jgi:hypothetical protein
MQNKVDLDTYIEMIRDGYPMTQASVDRIVAEGFCDEVSIVDPLPKGFEHHE